MLKHISETFQQTTDTYIYFLIELSHLIPTSGNESAGTHWPMAQIFL
jgi:hypothetical protein